jgi:hypothetical protein
VADTHYVVWTEALQKSVGYETWEDVVHACRVLPLRSHCRIYELRVSGEPGSSQSVEIYTGPAVGVTIDALEAG